MTTATASATRVRGQANLTLVFLLCIATFNFVDRQVLAILLQPIKEDLRPSDTELGLLTGIAFALCYAVVGVPLARLAETTSRRLIVGISLAVWSLLTAGCGLAQTFLQLFVLRMLVACAESGSSPSSQFMVADLFPPGKRAKAMAILACGYPVGVLLGLGLGGILNEVAGWRLAFIIVGLPGALFALVFLAVIREPTQDKRGASPPGQSIPSALKCIWSIRSYRFMALAVTAHVFAAAALNQWIAVYLIRTYSLGTAEVGVSLGLTFGIIGGAGTLLGGHFGDRLGSKDSRWFARLPALIVACGVPFAVAAYFAPTFSATLVCLGGVALTMNAHNGPFLCAVQTIAPPNLRATAAAFVLFLGGAIGQAGGPLVVGALSDALAPAAGVDSLRWALIAITPASLLAGLLFWLAGSSIAKDMSLTGKAGLPS